MRSERLKGGRQVHTWPDLRLGGMKVTGQRSGIRVGGKWLLAGQVVFIIPGQPFVWGTDCLF